MDDKPANPITTIENIEQDEDYGLIVTFSDGSIGTYTVGDLLKPKPNRALNPLKIMARRTNASHGGSS
jgi:hypothetical protein